MQKRAYLLLNGLNGDDKNIEYVAEYERRRYKDIIIYVHLGLNRCLHSEMNYEAKKW